MLQPLLVDPQLSGKHWLIESWYNYYYIIKSCTLFFDSVDSLDISNLTEVMPIKLWLQNSSH